MLKLKDTHWERSPELKLLSVGMAVPSQVRRTLSASEPTSVPPSSQSAIWDMQSIHQSWARPLPRNDLPGRPYISLVGMSTMG